MNYATGLGFLAVLFWATLAVTAQALKEIPVLLQLGLAFLGPGLLAFLPQFRFAWQQRNLIEILGSAFGLITYHYFLFLAFRLEEPTLVNSINYLWPLFLILLTPLFFKEKRLKWLHFLAGALCIAGIALQTKESSGFIWLSAGAYLAFFAALIWPFYSLVKAKWSQLPEGTSLVWSCLLSSVFFLFMALFQVDREINFSTTQGLMMVWMSLGPFGLAFYFWSLSLKKGDPRKIGFVSYLTPVLSTGFLWIYLDGPISVTQLTGFSLVILGLLLSGLS